ncbi:MAG: thiolase family protein [Candidatus Lokiarchaeota archaeon]|nr:thiolase family protein [Candidatus Lokiarchaeota archaeon]
MGDLREVVIVDAIRTPMGRSGWKAATKKGIHYYSTAQEMTAQVLKAIVERAKYMSSSFDPNEIEDVAFGCSAQFGEQGGNLGRIGVLVADLPDSIAGQTIDRYCNAGLQAVNSQAMAIATGAGDIMIAGGTEFLSRYPLGSSLSAVYFAKKSDKPYSHRIHKHFMKKSTIMGNSAELIADQYKITREELDDVAVYSHQQATKANRDTEFYNRRICPLKTTQFEEIAPGRTKSVRDENGNIKYIRALKDETPRSMYLDEPDAAREKLKALKPRFRPVGGIVTAGNSSAIVDGSSAVLLMSRDKADELGIKPLCTYVSSAVEGSDPIFMLLGPVPAMYKALKRAKKKMEDMNVIEPNEAFASPVVAFAKEFGYDYLDPRQNPLGGGISIGHPIGCSGSMYFGEMCWALVKRNQEWGIQTLCGGGGVGIATVVKRDKGETPTALKIPHDWAIAEKINYDIPAKQAERGIVDNKMMLPDLIKKYGPL